MTTLTASSTASGARRGGLRALLSRMVAAARADTARSRYRTLDDHLLRDVGLTRGDIEVMDLW